MHLIPKMLYWTIGSISFDDNTADKWQRMFIPHMFINGRETKVDLRALMKISNLILRSFNLEGN